MILNIKEQNDYGDLNYVNFKSEPYQTMLKFSPGSLGKALIRMHFLLYNSNEIDSNNRMRIDELDIILYFQEYEKVDLYGSSQLNLIIDEFLKLHEYLKNNFTRKQLMPTRII